MTKPDTQATKEAVKEIADQWRQEREAYYKRLASDPQADLIRQEEEDQKFYRLINTYARKAKGKRRKGK